MPWAELTDVKMYYELSGRGEPVILLPGMGATCRLLDPIVQQLDLEQFCHIGIDNRGVGQSIARRPARTLHDYSADLLELLDHLQIERVHVVGISLGGIIAQRFAVDHPSRVHRLVLMSCSHRFGPYLREMAMMLGNMLRHFSNDNFARYLELLSAGPTYLDADPQRLQRKVDESRELKISRMAVARQLRALGASDPKPGEYRIINPTLIVTGEYDALIPPCYQRAMWREIPGAIHMLIRKAGHNPLVECPDTLLPRIVEFLETGDTAPEDDQFVIKHQKEVIECVA